MKACGSNLQQCRPEEASGKVCDLRELSGTVTSFPHPCFSDWFATGRTLVFHLPFLAQIGQKGANFHIKNRFKSTPRKTQSEVILMHPIGSIIPLNDKAVIG